MFATFANMTGFKLFSLQTDTERDKTFTNIVCMFLFTLAAQYQTGEATNTNPFDVCRKTDGRWFKSAHARTLFGAGNIKLLQTLCLQTMRAQC